MPQKPVPKNGLHLIDDISEKLSPKGSKQGQDLLTFKGYYEEYRNEVTHCGRSVTTKTGNEILEKTRESSLFRTISGERIPGRAVN